MPRIQGNNEGLCKRAQQQRQKKALRRNTNAKCVLQFPYIRAPAETLSNNIKAFVIFMWFVHSKHSKKSLNLWLVHFMGTRFLRFLCFFQFCLCCSRTWFSLAICRKFILNNENEYQFGRNCLFSRCYRDRFSLHWILFTCDWNVVAAHTFHTSQNKIHQPMHRYSSCAFYFKTFFSLSFVCINKVNLYKIIHN